MATAITDEQTTQPGLRVEPDAERPKPSRRKFILGAMPGDTPHEVIAASYGVKPDVYREAVRS